MRRVQWLESVLACLCGRQRASEVIGDLLEQHDLASLSFASEVVGVAFALVWRSLAGAVLAMLAGMLFVTRFIDYAQVHGLLPSQESGWQYWSVKLMMAAVCVLSTAILSAVQTAWRDRVTVTAASVAGMLTASACLAWSDAAAYLVPSFLVVGLGALLAMSRARMAAACVAVASITFAGLFVGAMQLMGFFPQVKIALMVTFFGGWFVSLLASGWLLKKLRTALVKPTEA